MFAFGKMILLAASVLSLGGPGVVGAAGAEVVTAEEVYGAAGTAVCMDEPASADAGAVQTADTAVTAVDPAAFLLPDTARVLVTVEGLEGTACEVKAYEKTEEGWQERFCTAGLLGRNGMSYDRTEGDKTTPVGVWQLNTPFGQKPALEGFPENYIHVDESYVWTDRTNRLVRDTSQDGERVGSSGYSPYYNYVLDCGYNANAVERKGSALFIHCTAEGSDGSSGCVQVPEECMISLMRLYGRYGAGACFIAQAPQGRLPDMYDAYGANNGLSPAKK